jgi:hypothetical protein
LSEALVTEPDVALECRLQLLAGLEVAGFQYPHGAAIKPFDYVIGLVWLRRGGSLIDPKCVELVRPDCSAFAQPKTLGEEQLMV